MMNLYAEFLENLNQLNLIFCAERSLISNYTIDEKWLNLALKSSNEANIKINLNAFEYNPINLTEIKLNVQNESIFRLSSVKLINKPSYSGTPHTELSFITSIKCLTCRSDILKDSSCFNYLKLPENDLDELADNFFCHLHDHNHNKCHEQDLTSALNPMRENNQPRKSILGNLTLLVLNTNHLNPKSVEQDSLDLNCSKCMSNFGYQRKNSSDFYIWKSNVILNDCFVADVPYLGSQLGQGKYLFESRKTCRALFVWILNDQALFKQFKLAELNSEIELNFRIVKKCLFKLLAKEQDYNEIKRLKNDCNVNYILVSREQFDDLVTFLNESNSQLCPSLRKSNDFHFSIISD